MSVTFREVKADVLDRIARGIWEPGALMPNEAELAETYGCARATVNRAMRELAEDGIIERKRKAGTRVRMAPVRQARFAIPVVREEIEGQGAAYRYELVSREIKAPPDWLRARLSLPDGVAAVHVICMHFADGRPYQHENRWISLRAVPAARETSFARISPNEWLIAEVPFTTAEISFQAVRATADMAGYLGCAEGEALFQAERTTWLQGQAVTLVHLTHRPGHRMTARY